MATITKTILDVGDKTQHVCKYDEVALEYTGWVKDEKQPDGKGAQFDTSIGRGDSVIVIGSTHALPGQSLISNARSGWDIGVLGEYTPANSSEKVGPMALNERARFEFPPLYGFGRKGLPGLVPENATLIYEMKLKKIGPQKAP
ncbi:FK506 binding protein proline rotamase rapamycin-binding protein [Didymella heteroderae]|uniref:peptidylprolyl isomerase n=1 Tax=Didymella heteroderae TaxID=1769908 RepID=A0A9P4WVV6_9PLEO|nr:FK506 binding protein proline rotamase rapamycin-binding protein [Didymella heteroderae]